MCNICEYCCICLCDKNDLQCLSDTDNDQINYYNKLTSLIPEMCFNELDDQRLLCKECCDIINVMYKFREKCLNSKTMLINYITELHSVVNIDKIDIDDTEFDENYSEIKEKLIKMERDEENYEENLIDSYAIKFISVEEIKIEKEDELQTTDLERYENSFSSFVKSEKSANENNYEDNNKQQDYTGNIHENENTEIYETTPSLETINNKNITSDTVIITDEGKIYKCDFCQRKFNRKGSFVTHRRIHTGERPYKCNLCDKRFVQKTALNEHKRTHTGERPHECDSCDKKFTQKSALNDHKKTHTGERPHKCHLCEKDFARKTTLTEHIIMHTGILPFECKLCDKRFVRNSKLTEHMKIHSGERPFQCHICQKRFLRKPALMDHIRIHTDDKPHKCHLCVKKFFQKTALTNHMRTHTGERPFACDLCDRKFAQKRTLTIHSKVHANQRPLNGRF